MFTIVFQRFLPGRQVAESPRPRLFKPDRPRIFRQQFMSFEKKHFYTRCAGLSVICAPNSIYPGLTGESFPFPSLLTPAPSSQGGGIPRKVLLQCATPPPPRSYTRALLVSQDRRHLFVTPCVILWPSKSMEKTICLSAVYTVRDPGLVSSALHVVHGVLHPGRDRHC